MPISSERRWYFSSESVTEGHPDKVADAISDSVLDAVLTSDPEGRVACEALVTKRRAVVAGEITSTADVDIEAITRKTIAGIGYDGFDEDFDAATLEVEMLIQPQSRDIAEGVDNKGAGDQGIMFGFAVDETPELMPVPIQLAHRLAERLTAARLDGSIPYLRPDGKTQVMVEYRGRLPVRVTKILISAHHQEGVDIDGMMRHDLFSAVIERVVPAEMIEDLSASDVLVNPTGRFVSGGPVADTGLTGRKVIVDTYGGYARHGGGAFSGKDPTKVDRSAAYAARHAAKNVVAAGLAAKCELQLAYAIGVDEPFSIHVETFGTEQIDPAKLERLIGGVFDFRPVQIIERLDLRRPIYRPTAAYGHFGRPSFPWEALDYAELLAAEARSL